ncbi:MAG: OsmC family protein [Candidatus Eremiobacteraeota bacterium]|nr:OsmC family protein [Candidatus Eremiobacteraeota bacterium]
MAIDRAANAVWDGDLKGGHGKLSSKSGVLKETPYSFATRFENAPGTNPEELIAAAHAGCYSMALSLVLGNHGYHPRSIQTHAICSIAPQAGGGFAITRMRLESRGNVPELNEAKFQEIAREAEAACPVSNALRGNVDIELSATLLTPV